jgi:hypothetical protein
MVRSFRIICTAALTLLMTASAFAQGFYYKEIQKDGRIYVFNIAANAERFEKSGEMAAGITKPGVGPNGETVVGDNERALQLYFFRHGISVLVPDPPTPAPAPAPWRISGLMFGDYYAFPRQHLAAWDDQHGLWFRRLYLTYDHTFTPKLSTRFRLEANSNGKLQGGLLTPYIKDAYLRWNAFGRQALTLGIQPSLSFEFVETVWGLRHIEKTPLDLYRWDSSRDTGVTLSGPLNETQTLKYAVQYGNESGNNGETDKFKGYRATARYETNPGLTVEAMVAQFERDKDADRTTAQLFAAYRGKRARAGAQYSFQKRRAAAGATAADIEMTIYSAFGVFDLKRGKSSAFVRVDRYADPCADCSGIDYLPIDTKEAFTTTIAGVEWFVTPAVRFSPNVEWVTYSTPSGAGASTPKDDTALRLTFFWTW